MSPAVFGHGRLRLYLLKLLDESPRHGYDVIRELEDRFMGLYSPSAGTVYPRLARLESEGLVTHEVADGRKVYSITAAGRAELAARSGELEDLEADIAGSVKDLADEIRSEVHGSVKDLKAELKAAARDLRREARSRGRQPGQPAGASQTSWGTSSGSSSAGREGARGEGWFDWHRLLDEALGTGMSAGIEGGIDIRIREEISKASRRSGRRMPDDEQWAQIRVVLATAVDDIRRILARDPG